MLLCSLPRPAWRPTPRSMSRSASRRASLLHRPGQKPFLAAILLVAATAMGCHSLPFARRRRHHAVIPPLIQAPPTASAHDLLVDEQKKVVMGRPLSFAQVERVSRTVQPILNQAIEQPQIQSLLRQDARDVHLSEAAFKRYFVAHQEADILLESGGDPDALSRAGAAGVAQWLGDTARARGSLRIDELASRSLTARIQHDLESLVWLRQQPPAFSGTLQTVSGAVSTPNAVPHLPPGEVAQSRDSLLAAINQDMKQLEAQRRAVDQRYDPRAALFAQTRYLLWMWQRFPSVDWVFEAYHGGEGAVSRTLETYLGPKWARAGSVTRAILGEEEHPARPLSYEQIFFATTPRSHPATFAYLYGLHDEHRIYWFKLLMAGRALAWYRRDARSFRNEWLALRPGWRMEDAWYPEMRLYPDPAAVRTAKRRGELVALPPLAGVQGRQIPELSEALSSQWNVARPEVFGALAEVARVYRQESSHPLPLQIVAMTQPEDEVMKFRQRFPYPPPKATPEPGAVPLSLLPDPHAAGLAIAVQKLTDRDQERILEYSLHYWEDRERLHFNSESWGKLEAWRIVPNPLYRPELERAARPGR